MNFLFLMDPLEKIVLEKDTSFALMLGSYKRGHQIYFIGDGDIIYKNGTFTFDALQVIPQRKADNPFIKQKQVTLREENVDCIFVRNDPPFDMQYLMNTWLLDRLSPRIVVINSARGIRTANEKIWATQFKSIVPPTFIGRKKKDMLSFLEEQKDIVAKPTDGYGGQGVYHLKKGDPNTNVIFESLTETGARDIILQRFVPESQKGDKRILLLNGEPLGAVLRVHAEYDFRNNFFAGGKPVACKMDDRDQMIIETLKPKLKELGLYFAGIDVMGGYLIEVNVTSPTCLQEMNKLYETNLEDKVIAFAEDLVKKNSALVSF